jgi:phage baseplate assembly protein W
MPETLRKNPAGQAAVSWPFLLQPDERGELRFPTPEESVRQMIEVILRTVPGEQLMHPEYGTGLSRFLHDPNDVPTWREIRDAVTSGLASFEPRITVDRVEVTAVSDRPKDVRVEIAYRLRRTGQARALGFTMALGGG